MQKLIKKVSDIPKLFKVTVLFSASLIVISSSWTAIPIFPFSKNYLRIEKNSRSDVSTLIIDEVFKITTNGNKEVIR